MCTLPCPLSSGSKHVQLQENSFVPLGATQAFVCIVSSFGKIYRNPKTLAACVCSGTVLSAKQAGVNYDWDEQRIWQHELQVWRVAIYMFWSILSAQLLSANRKVHRLWFQWLLFAVLSVVFQADPEPAVLGATTSGDKVRRLCASTTTCSRDSLLSQPCQNLQRKSMAWSLTCSWNCKLIN